MSSQQIVKLIAEGAPFDTTQAIRHICIRLTEIRINVENDTPTPLLFPKNVALTNKLAQAGIITPYDLSLATDDDLLAIPGITKKDVARIRQGA